MHKSIVEFSRVLGWWWAAIVFAVLSGGVGLWQQLVDAEIVPPLGGGPVVIPTWAWWLASMVGFALGGFAAFHKVRLERDELRERRPRLQFDFVQVVQSESSPFLGIFGNISNTGPMPSVVRSSSWEVSVTTVYGEVVQPKLIYHAESVTVQMISGEERQWEASAQLMVQGQSPIPEGGDIEGPLYCQLPRVMSHTEISSVEVRFQDVLRNPYVAKNDRRGLTTTLPYVRGGTTPKPPVPDTSADPHPSTESGDPEK